MLVGKQHVCKYLYAKKTNSKVENQNEASVCKKKTNSEVEKQNKVSLYAKETMSQVENQNEISKEV
jgi:hypothetical protein